MLKLRPRVALATTLISGALTFAAPVANASSYTLDFDAGNNAGQFSPNGPAGDFNVNLTITTTGPAFSRYGFNDGQLITGVSGTITGINGTVYSSSVATGYTGNWAPTPQPGQSFPVTAGLYTSGAAPGIFTEHGVFNSGGADFILDNAWFPTSTLGIDNDGGIGLLLANGASVLIFANCNPDQSCSGYWLGITASPVGGGPQAEVGVSATPLPAALPLFATGLAGFGWLARRKRKHVA